MDINNAAIYVADDRLYKYAQNTARSYKTDGQASFNRISREYAGRLRNIKRVHAMVNLHIASRTSIPTEMEWLCDNWYLAEKEGRSALMSFKRAGKAPSSYKNSGDFLICISLARALTRASKNKITRNRIELFLEGVQSVLPLSEREIWLFSSCIAGAIIEDIDEVCEEIEEILRCYDMREENPFKIELAAEGEMHKGNVGEEKNIRACEAAQKAHSALATRLENSFTSLRFLGTANLNQLLQQLSPLERKLSEDPARVYPEMDEQSRAAYRRAAARIARKNNISEIECASRIIELCRAAKDERMRHVGYYIAEAPLGKKRPALRRTLYASLIWSGIIFFEALILYLTQNLALSLILVFPIWEIMKNLTDFAALKTLPPSHIPRLELKDGLPESGKTLCVVSVLLTSPKRASEVVKLLGEYRHSNRDCGINLLFGVLADLKDTKKVDKAADEAILSAARVEIDRLNHEFGGGFYLFTRERAYNDRDKVYMGKERKRGAVSALTRFLRNMDSEIKVYGGNTDGLSRVQYCITLDSDTRLCPGTAKKLCSAMMHPMNRPVIDSKRGVVVRGYGIMQPRVSVELRAASQTMFSRIYAGQGGIDPYGCAMSDIYQDLFLEGIFTGKGIFDVDAYVKVLDGTIPDNTVLSHDLLEGGYLRAGLIGDVELTDSFPPRPIAWYDRAHRWIRGDFQLIPWLCPKVRRVDGEKSANPLSTLTRYKIFDNLRRGVTPVMLLTALLISAILPVRAAAVCIAAALLCIISPLLITSGEMLFRGGQGFKARYHSTIITGFKGAALQVFSQLIFLPFCAWISVTAIFTALWRMLVSRRKMLAWITAAESDNKKGTLGRCVKRMLPAILVGIYTLFAGKQNGLWLFGIFWILSPLYAYILGLPAAHSPKLTDNDREYLTQKVREMWGYFESFLTPNDNYLPPDNWQKQPAVGLAHRTSPTNIGLALLCVTGARDMGIIDTNRMLFLLEKITETMEKLEKWNGHPINWYDTETLRPLHPRWVSTVDNGNLLGYMLTCIQALREIDDPRAESLAARLKSLGEDMHFTPLFDKERQLFFIGFDLEKQKHSEAWYDLLASEARQTSFITIARGEIELKHWGRLGRSLATRDGYFGMSSWTGTMFEYLMPNLILPICENSLTYESARFCFYCHKRRAERMGTPYGISESAFYAFDSAMNYQYKAHGVQTIALKRGLGSEHVISPYSSYLSLELDPSDAIKNLRRMEKEGLSGEYGHFEAADYTEARMPRGKNSVVVRCYMSHHLGMSFIAAVNCLMDNIFQKRFLRDNRMAAFVPLLEEKVPSEAVVVRWTPRDVPEKPQVVQGQGYVAQYSGYNPFSPRCHILSNGSYTLMITDGGVSASSCSGLSLTRFDPDIDSKAFGILFFLKINGQLFSLQPAPFFNEKSSVFSSRFTAKGATICRCDGIASTVRTFVAENDNAELREVELKYPGARECELVAYFEPVLSPNRDYSSHPAFSRLFLETENIKGGVKITRRPRDGGARHSAVFLTDAPYPSFDTSREEALGRGGISSLEKGISVEGRAGAVLDPCVLCSVPLNINETGSVRVRFALSYAQNGADAISGAERIITAHDPFASEGGGRLDGLCNRLGIKPAEAAAAMDIIPKLLFITPARRTLAGYIQSCRGGVETLWKYCISGDLPIVCVSAENASDFTRAHAQILRHRLLSQSGMSYDLVILAGDGGDYRRPVRVLTLEALKSCGGDGSLGARGGVHLVDKTTMSTEDTDVLLSAAAVFDDGESQPVQQSTEFEGLPVKKAPQPDELPPYSPSPGEYVINKLPPLAHSTVLANRSFGYIAADSGCGHLWRLNARQNKLTAWTNDPLALSGGESIRYVSGEESFSLFLDRDGLLSRAILAPGYATFEKSAKDIKITATAFVHKSEAVRIMIIRADAQSDGYIEWSMRPILGVDSGSMRHTVTNIDPNTGALYAQNPFYPEFAPECFFILSSEKFEDFTCDYSAFLKGEMNGAYGAGYLPCMAGRVPVKKGVSEIVLLCGCVDKPLQIGCLSKLLDIKKSRDALSENMERLKELTQPVKIHTPDPVLDEYINHWTLYQVLCCRIWGRTSVYQCGGAYGLRDQLQDACALSLSAPELLKNQILRAASRQYTEGDAQHWWHPERGGKIQRGVRTRCSDDLLWIAYALCEYIDKTGDREILNLRAPFLESPVLSKKEHERYEAPRERAEYADMYEHARRAIDQVLRRGTGKRGLPLMLGGDWNDGFNLVGAGGRGESVWLAWFLSHTLTRFSKICELRGDEIFKSLCLETAKRMGEAAENAYLGDWYLRATFDDGSPLGTSENEECRLDSIAQSFAFLSEQSDPAHRENALKHALDMLFDRDAGVVKLFSPPFENGRHNPGYIRAYLPGVRENGGQYTHGAVWLAMACCKACRGQDAYDVLRALLPGHHPQHIYKADPHVIAADVYTAQGHLGRGGWSFYTGAASWYFRVCVEDFLGIRISGGRLYINPCIPDSWPGFEAELNFNGGKYKITVSRTEGVPPQEEGYPLDENGMEIRIKI